jgi:hypothetical protein
MRLRYHSRTGGSRGDMVNCHFNMACRRACLPAFGSPFWAAFGRGAMASMRGIQVASVLLLMLISGCSTPATTGGVCQCPKPVAYDDATIKKITQALRALPPDNVLHQAMDDYEDERDDLRACLAARH